MMKFNLILLVLLFISTDSWSQATTPIETTEKATEKKLDSKTEQKKSVGADKTVKNDETGDVYNFYFQKAEGPSTVQQGGASKSVTAPQKASPKIAKPQPTQDDSTLIGRVKDGIGVKKSYFPYEVMVSGGLVQEGNRQYKGNGISGAYNLNRYVGIVGGLNHSRAPGVGMSHERSFAEGWDMHALGVLTPIHLRFFDHTLFELGFGVGFMTGENEADRPAGYANGEKELKFAIGLRFAINLSDNIALVTLSRSSDASTHSDFGLRYRF